MKTKKRNPYTLFDHIFAIAIVACMVLLLFAVPFLCFYFLLQFVSLTLYVEMNAAHIWGKMAIAAKFFIFACAAAVIADVIFTKT
ncbi:hypothetical protein BpJC7_26560 [Weizmannia acidilactici]|uniref:Uncharacterized protein n=1 Tax=Weizmannia acidilactici TaxID=2607726 RepID=A0A5J4JGY1_9BACI|nr:hypothetical protein [Weizmannia acidilactici]GER68268.1 hypothetical protein BpJC4_27390 [Weizmannia acidilactici]GER71353.1 hypothetical protein BpJC7_26560 [Weizmannia acidilactici]GER72541.1 hypothetical protein BpPP18_06080 [Weizmannia acidilactici]